MSKISQFLIECQDIAENSFNESPEAIESLVRARFSVEKEAHLLPYAVETTMSLYDEIRKDLDSYRY